MDNTLYLLRAIFESLISLAVCGVMPVLIVWLCLKKKKNDNDKRTEIVLAAMEKNNEIDVEEFIKTLNPPQRPLRERLILRLHWELMLGGIFTIFGIVDFIVLAILRFGYQIPKEDIYAVGLVFGIPVFAIGVGLLIAYAYGKKTLANLKDED